MARGSKPLRNGSSRFKPIQAIYGYDLIGLERGTYMAMARPARTRLLLVILLTDALGGGMESEK
jgi:hypothetical protein